MGMIVSPTWKENIEIKINQTIKIDEITGYNKAAQWLITRLSQVNIPYKVYNLGAGVKRITTDTDTCPCCKHKV